MLAADARLRRKGSEIIGLAVQTTAALSCSLLFRGTSGNPAGPLDASEMTELTSRPDDATKPAGPRAGHRPARFLAALLTAATLSLGGCGDAFMQVYQRGYVLPEGALEQVPLGASQEQVLIVLGTPTTVATVSGETFYYISQRAEQKLAFLQPGRHQPAGDRGLFRQEPAGAAARQLRPQGRQGVRLHQPHHADQRHRAELRQLHLRADQAARRLRIAAQRKTPRLAPRGFRLQWPPDQPCASTASSSSATMLVILIIGLTAGPAVSL